LKRKKKKLIGAERKKKGKRNEREKNQFQKGIEQREWDEKKEREE
jgi:hypothetical protein